MNDQRPCHADRLHDQRQFGRGGGGGVFNYGTASLVACTVSGNSAPQGGGIDNYSSPYYTSRTTLRTRSSPLNTTGSGGAASDIGGTDPGDVTGSHNLIGTGGAGGLTAANHNLLNVANPGLTPLGDYGGPTETMALQPNSPARHAGPRPRRHHRPARLRARRPA